MTVPLADWPRPYFVEPGDPAMLFYVAYGALPQPLQVSRNRYRCDGLAPLDLMHYGPEADPDVVGSFRDGYLWDTLQRESLELANAIAEQTECVILRGDIPDAPDLNVFRNAVGMLTYLLDQGAVAIYDPQMFKWWSADAWRERAFAPEGPVPRHHVVVLFSQEFDGEWLHTRGMRKFGRPDLSIHRVPAGHRAAVVDLLNRLIEQQALGAIIPEGQQIRLAALPPGMRCRHRGALDDPDFNNVHIEVEWPDAAHRGFA